MQTRMSQMTSWTLTITILAVVASIVLLTLEIGGDVRVPTDVFIAIAVAGAACGVGWIAITCTKQIIDYIDNRVHQRDADHDQRVDSVVNSLAEVRISVGEFAATVREYGDQRAQAARLEALQSLADDAGGVTRIGQRAAR